MKRDAAFGDQFDKIIRLVTRQGRAHEMWILRTIMLRLYRAIGEVAAATARHENLPTELCGVIDHQHSSSALRRRRRTQQPSSPATKDDYVRKTLHRWVAESADSSVVSAPEKIGDGAPKGGTTTDDI